MDGSQFATLLVHGGDPKNLPGKACDPDKRLSIWAKRVRDQGGSSGAARDPDCRNPGWRGVTTTPGQLPY